MAIKTILVSQPKPEGDKSPYFDLAEKYDLKIEFRSFIHVEGIGAQEFRTQKVDLNEHTAVILTSKTAVDHYFRIAKDMRVLISADTRYFCISEAIAYYLQKYVVYRKRKIYHGNLTIEELIPTLKKFKNEKFLMPSSDTLKPSIPNALEEAGIEYKRAILFNTVVDLSDLENVYFDMLVFYSPGGIESLLKNYPDFKQNSTVIAAFGPTTASAIIKNNLKLGLHAPQPNAPSMTGAIENYVKEQLKVNS